MRPNILARAMRPPATPLVAIVVAAAISFASGLAPGAVAQEDEAMRPSLADLMALTQLRHYKLWHAQKVGNWPLSAYQLSQFAQTIRRIVQLYPKTSAISQADLIHEKTDPAMAALRQALADKNNARFEAAYAQLTSACNQCHQAAGVGFIVVQTPKPSPFSFSNQRFEPAR
jgi:hypothetical protein